MKKVLVLVLAMLLCISPMAFAAETEGDGAAVEESHWWDNLPRESWSQFESVDSGSDWYSVYKMPGDVYAIYEDGQWQEVICYLILGQEKAMLWDTGMGIGNIKEVVEKLTDLPVFVLNSHSHHDHIGCNAMFDEVWCYDSEECVAKISAGNPHDAIAYEVSEESVWKDFPEGFDPETYAEEGKVPTNTVKDGDVIDLGGRTLEVVYTPGHTADSIMLIDEANGLLFTGDTYYPAPLYAFSDDSDFTEYAASMRKIADKVAGMGIQWIYASHNEVVAGTEVLGEVADDMQSILDGEKTDYTMDDQGRRNYEFDNNIRIITLDNID